MKANKFPKRIIAHIIELSAFLEGTFELFERNWERNVYLVHSGKSQHISKSRVLKSRNVYVFEKTDDIIDFLILREEWIGLVIFHMIWAPYKRKILNAIKGKLLVHGIIWGWEIYENNLLFDPLLPWTKKALHKKELSELPLFIAAKHWLKNKIKWRGKTKEDVLSAQIYHINQYTSISTLMESEYVYLKRKFNVTPIYLPFKYPIPLSDSLDKSLEGWDILIGNSSSITNNHLDILKSIGRINSNSRIILPMSYGYNPIKPTILKEYKIRYGNKVLVLDKFLSSKDYDSLLDSCGYVIMNQLRQQALGNIYSALFKGAKVFLNENGILYSELIKKGFIVFKLNKFKREYGKPLSVELKLRNQELVVRDRGNEALDSCVRRMLNLYFNN